MATTATASDKAVAFLEVDYIARGLLDMEVGSGDALAHVAQAEGKGLAGFADAYADGGSEEYAVAHGCAGFDAPVGHGGAVEARHEVAAHGGEDGHAPFHVAGAQASLVDVVAGAGAYADLKILAEAVAYGEVDFGQTHVVAVEMAGVTAESFGCKPYATLEGGVVLLVGVVAFRWDALYLVFLGRCSKSH